MLKDEMRAEYDFLQAVRGKHHKSYRESVNVIFLEADIAKVFKDSEAVNHALRMLMELEGNELKRNYTKSSA